MGRAAWLRGREGLYRDRVGRVAVIFAIVVVVARGARPQSGTGSAAPGLREGRHQNADFFIGLPEKWNGALVMFAHGYQGEGPGRGAVESWPLSHLTEQGYAWAASGYRSRGYRPDWFIADTLALRERFIREVGRPRWTVIHGQSMGGHVAIASL